MSKKGYSEKDREQVGQKLLTVGLEMLSQRGLKDTTLQDILQAVGISKPFFYGNYYTSLAELVTHIINYELVLLFQMGCEDAARQDLSLEEKNSSPSYYSHLQPPTPFLRNDPRGGTVGAPAFKR